MTVNSTFIFICKVTSTGHTLHTLRTHPSLGETGVGITAIVALSFVMLNINWLSLEPTWPTGSKGVYQMSSALESEMCNWLRWTDVMWWACFTDGSSEGFRQVRAVTCKTLFTRTGTAWLDRHRLDHRVAIFWGTRNTCWILSWHSTLFKYKVNRWKTNQLKLYSEKRNTVQNKSKPLDVSFFKWQVGP